ncbi:MAG: hypothetical protein ACT4P6_10640 [Gemmatimonadaceae bacterium]
MPFAVRSAAMALVPATMKFGVEEKAVIHPGTKEAIRHSLMAWTFLLGAAINSTASSAELREKIVKDLDVVRLGYNWVGTLMLATKRLKPAHIEEVALKHGLTSQPSDRVRCLVEGTLKHEEIMRREMPAPQKGPFTPAVAWRSHETDVTDPRRAREAPRHHAKARQRKEVGCA